MSVPQLMGFELFPSPHVGEMTKKKFWNAGTVLFKRQSQLSTFNAFQSTQGQEFGKPRQGSNDKEHFSECRESLMQEEELVEHSKITKGHKGSKREDYF